MSKLSYILLLILGLIIQANVARAQQQSNITRHTQQVLPPYQPMNESEWNEVKKEISDSTLKVVDKICAQKMIVLSLISRDSVREKELDLLYAKQYNLAKEFKEVANTKEIELLGNHPNGMVRYYAVSLLMSQSLTERYAVLYMHINDTEYIPIDYDSYFISIDTTKARVGDLLLGCSKDNTEYYRLYDNQDKRSPNYKIQTAEFYKQLTNDLIRAPNFLFNTYYEFDNYYGDLYHSSKADSLKFITDTTIVKGFKELIHQAINENNDAALACLSNVHHYMIHSTDFVGLRDMYKNLNDTVIVAIFEYLNDQSGSYTWYSKEDKIKKYYSYLDDTYKKQDRLLPIIKKYCTVDDLKKLLQHPRYSIQGCVFNILLEDSSFDPINHLKSSIELAKNQPQIYYPPINDRINDFARWSSQKLKYPKKAELDSLIFYAPFYIEGIRSVIEKIPPTPYYRARILELAKEDRYHVKEEAILKLAEYHNLADTSFFIVHKKTNNDYGLNYELNYGAIKRFPHPYFIPYLMPYLRRFVDAAIYHKSKDTFTLNYLKIYNNKESKRLLEKYNKASVNWQ